MSLKIVQGYKVFQNHTDEQGTCKVLLVIRRIGLNSCLRYTITDI